MTIAALLGGDTVPAGSFHAQGGDTVPAGSFHVSPLVPISPAY